MLRTMYQRHIKFSTQMNSLVSLIRLASMEFCLAFVLLCSVFLRSSNSQDAQEDNTHKLTAPESFITNGTRKLNLTCGTDVSEDVAYTWFFPPGNGPRVCDSQKPIHVCSFVPRVDDDTQDVICVATARNGSQLFRATYALNLTYPPESSATISIEPPQTEPLAQGDTITCTVTGGKPRVTNVTFHCQHPDHADREDDVSNDGRTVSSSITVDTSQATEVNMTCTCSANWDPVPKLYEDITNAEFMLEYKSIVTNFTVNGNTSKTVAESQMVMFWCQGAGRPSPTLILRKRGTDTVIANDSTYGEGLMHPISSAQCHDLDTYTCEANNNFPDPNSTTVQLLVTCSTRPADDYVDIANIYNLTQAGRTFTVVGYPTPEITVSFCGDNTARECQPAAENAFVTSCTRNVTTEHLVHCAITPVNITEDKTGLYNMNMTNAQGTFTVTFQILQAVSPPQSTTPLTEDAGLSPVAVTGIFVGTIFLLILLLIIVFCEINRVKKVNSSNDRDQQCRDTADVHPRNDTLHQLQQQTQQRRQQQRSVVQAQPQDARVYQNMPGNHTYNNDGNTYDVLQTDQQDDARTYTDLVTSSGADSDTYLELVNSSKGDYEIP